MAIIVSGDGDRKPPRHRTLAGRAVRALASGRESEENLTDAVAGVTNPAAAVSRRRHGARPRESR